MVARPFLRRARLPRLAWPPPPPRAGTPRSGTPARAPGPARRSQPRPAFLSESRVRPAEGTRARASAPSPGSWRQARDGIMPSGPPGPGELRGAGVGSAGSPWVFGAPSPGPTGRGAGTVLWVGSRFHAQWGVPVRGESRDPRLCRAQDV